MGRRTMRFVVVFVLASVCTPKGKICWLREVARVCSSACWYEDIAKKTNGRKERRGGRTGNTRGER